VTHVTVIDRDETRRSVELHGSGSLMHVLRDAEGFDVAGQCGGFCICATCHVLLDVDSYTALGAPSPDELELIGQLQHGSDHSRLACQIDISTLPDGAAVRIAPEE